MSTRGSSDLIRTILFDAEGVLQRTDDGWHDTLVALLGERADAEGDDFVLAIQRAEAPTMDGRIDINEAMRGVLRDFSVDAHVDDILDVWTKIEPNPDMLAAVLELRRQGVQCCLTTNQQSRRAEWMRDNLTYSQVFDEEFYSCELGLAKPDPAIFRLTEERLGVQPHEIVFLDDNEDAVAAGRERGWHAVLHRSTTTSIRNVRKILLTY